MRRISKKTWIIVGTAAALILLVIAFASCSAQRKESDAYDSLDGSQASAVGCYPPLACGPHYAGYIPPYYAMHPSYLYLSPYRALYSPVLVGKTYVVSRTPAGLAPVSTRPPMPYPKGYKPVPGDFQAPTSKVTAPAPAPTVPARNAPAPTAAARNAPADKAAPQKVPAVKVPAAKTPSTSRK